MVKMLQHGKELQKKFIRQFLKWVHKRLQWETTHGINKKFLNLLIDAEYLFDQQTFQKEHREKELSIVKCNGTEVAVINLQGRTFLPPIDCPFRKADELIEVSKKTYKIIFVDFHAEATSEKQAMGWYLDGSAQQSLEHIPMFKQLITDFTERNSIYNRCRDDRPI